MEELGKSVSENLHPTLPRHIFPAGIEKRFELMGDIILQLFKLQRIDAHSFLLWLTLMESVKIPGRTAISKSRRYFSR